MSVGLKDLCDRYAQALAAEQRAKLRFTSYAARDKAVEKRKAARKAMVDAIDLHMKRLTELERRQ